MFHSHFLSTNGSPLNVAVASTGDVGIPSVCREYVLSPLVNREPTLGLKLHRVEKSRNSKQR